MAGVLGELLLSLFLKKQPSMLHFVAPYSSGRFDAAHVEKTIVTYNLIYNILKIQRRRWSEERILVKIFGSSIMEYGVAIPRAPGLA